MSAKDYLRQIEKISQTIDNKVEEIESLRTLATKITSAFQLDKVQSSSPVQSKVENCVDKIIDFQTDILEEVNELIERKKEAMNIIDSLDGIYSNILYKRYFQYMTFDEIADELGCTRQWVCKLHGEALKKVEEVYKS